MPSIKVVRNGRLRGDRALNFFICLQLHLRRKQPLEIPRFVNIKIQVKVLVELDSELGGNIFLVQLPKVDDSLLFTSLKQLQEASSFSLQAFLAYGDKIINLALENRGIFKWHFTTKVKANKKGKVPYPP